MVVLARETERERLLRLIIESELQRGRPLPTELPIQRAGVPSMPQLAPIDWVTGAPTQERQRLQFEVVTEERPQRPFAPQLPMRQEPRVGDIRRALPQFQPPPQIPQRITPQLPTPEPEKVPLLKQIVGKIGEAFEWLQENLEEPWAEFVTTPLRSGESYEAWKGKHKLLSGIAEFSMPLWWLPYFGWAARGAGVIPRIGGSIAKGIRATERTLALPVTIPLKGVSKGLSKIIKLPKYQKIKTDMFREDRFRQLGERIARIPGMRAVMKAANPTVAVQGNLAYEGKMIHGGLSAFAESAVNLNMTNLTRIHINPVKLFELDDLGRMAKVINPTTKRQANWWDVASELPKYTNQLNKTQLEYFRVYGGMIDQAVRMAEEVGIKITKREFLEGTRYIPRIWQGKTGLLETETGIFRPVGTAMESEKWIANTVHKMIPTTIALKSVGVATSRIGGKQFFQKPRVYDFAEEALEAGLQPGRFVDPNVVMDTYQKGIYKLIVDKEVGQAMAPLGRTIKELTNSTIRMEAVDARLAVGGLNSVSKVIQRVIRGETIPEQTIKAVERRLPEIGGKLRVLARKPVTSQTKLELQSLAAEAKSLLPSARDRLSSAVSQRKIAYELARGTAGWRAVGQPFAAGRLFPDPIAKELNQMLTDRAMPILTKASNVNALSRFMVTGFDFGAGLIQGVPLLMTDPIKWGKAMGLSVAAFAKPTIRARYLQQPENLRVLQKLIPEGLLIGDSEFMQAVAGGGLLTGKVVQSIDRLNAIQRFSTSFNTFGDIARIEWAKGLLPMVERTGGSLKDLASFLNQATGVMSSRALGIGASQRSLEGSVLLFAPRYFRANISLWADMTRGGLRGELARDTLASMIMGTFFWYYGVTKALGQEPNFDPSSGKFLTIQIGQDHIGLGSMQVAMFRLLGNIYKTAMDDPTGFIKLDSRDNPLVRFTRSRVSPITGSAWDILTGKNFIGEPLDTPFDIGKHAFARRLIPFWADGLIFDRPRAGVPKSLFEVIGARAWPLQLWERRDELREKLARDTFGKPWYSTEDEMRITSLQRKQLEEKSPDLLRLTEEAYADRLRKGGVKEDTWNAYSQARKLASKVRDEQVWASQEQYDAGEINGFQFKEKLQRIASELRGAYRNIEGNPAFAEIIEHFNEPLTYEQMKDTPLEDIAFDSYMSMFYSPDMYDATGEYLYDRADTLDDIFISQYGQQMVDYVKQRLSQGKDIPPLMQEYYTAQEVLRPYWEVKGDADRYFGLMDSSNKRAFIKRRRDVLKRTNPLIARYIKLFYTQ